MKGSETARARVRRARAETLAALRKAYRNALEQAGIRYDVTFDAQTRGQEDGGDVARRCLEIAEAAFYVEFSRACFDDKEHGTGGWPLPDYEYARFYQSPKRVQEIAEQRLLGKLLEDDGRFPKGRP